MTITAKLSAKGREGKPYVGSDMDSKRVYIVQTDSYSQNEVDILFSGVLPKRGDQLQGFPFVFAKTCDLKQHDQNPTLWIATINYGPDTFSEKEKEKQRVPNPLDRAAEIDWGSVAYTLPITEDLDGKAITNSAGDPYDPPAERTDYYWATHITKNMASPPTWLIDYAGAVNDSFYMLDGILVQPTCSRLVDLRIGKRQRENGYSFREVRLSIEHRAKREKRTPTENPATIPSPFDLEMLDHGFHQWDGTTRSRVFTTDKPRQPVSAPVLLDGLGMPLNDPTTDTPVFRKFRTTKRKSFHVLPLT